MNDSLNDSAQGCEACHDDNAGGDGARLVKELEPPCVMRLSHEYEVLVELRRDKILDQD